jgi:hypothetical protein
MKKTSFTRIVVASAAVVLTLLAVRCSCDSDGIHHFDGWNQDTPGDWPEGYDVPQPDVQPDQPVDFPITDTLTEEQICGEEEFNIQHVTPDMLIVLDRSNSMFYNSFWDPTRNAVVSISTTYQDTILFGLMVFPSLSCMNGVTGECEPGRTPNVPVALNNGAAISSALSSMTTCGGTPIAETLQQAHAYLLGLTDTNPKYVLLATDGAPNCNTGLNGMTCRCTCTNPALCSVCSEYNVNCLDDTRTYDAIDAMYADRIRTFVVGMSTAAVEWGDVLGQIATRGGTEQFYPAEDPSQLQTAFEAITGMVATCEFDLNPSDAADPNQVNFYFDGVVVPRDPTNTNGWNWVDEDTIAFYGTPCDQIMSASVGTISAKYGCPTIII